MIEKPKHLPDHPEILIQDTMGNMLNAPFGSASVVVVPRKLEHDFTGVAQWILENPAKYRRYGRPAFIETLSLREYKDLLLMRKTPFKTQSEFLIHEMETIEQTGACPELRATFNTEIYFVFHTDPAKKTNEERARGKILSFYEGLPTEGLLSHQVMNSEFPFEAKPGERPFAFQLGDAWRHAECGSFTTAEPFVHRSRNGGGYRLGIVAD